MGPFHPYLGSVRQLRSAWASDFEPVFERIVFERIV